MSDPSMTDPKNSPVTRRPPGAVPERTQSVAAWMPFYIGDYLRETSRLTTEGHGAYLLLLFDYWTSGTALPDDDGQLAQIVRSTPAAWRRLRPQLERFFSVANGVWRHARSDRELAKTQRLSDERSRAGSRGAAQRWQSHGPAIAKDMASEVTTGMTQPLATGSQEPGKTMANHNHSHNHNHHHSHSHSHHHWHRPGRVQVARQSAGPLAGRRAAQGRLASRGPMPGPGTMRPKGRRSSGASTPYAATISASGRRRRCARMRSRSPRRGLRSAPRSSSAASSSTSACAAPPSAARRHR